MDKWCETIVWHKYPECNANLIMGKKYLVKFRDGYWQEDYWEGKEKINRWRVTPDSSVVYFADLPTGSIGDEFGFETALMLMKWFVPNNEYVCCRLVENPDIVLTISGGLIHRVVMDKDIIVGIVSTEYLLSLPEILGKWRLA